jgi:hypothetical protein
MTEWVSFNGFGFWVLGFGLRVLVFDLKIPSTSRWRQGRDVGAGTWRTCPLRVQRRQFRSFRRGLSERSEFRSRLNCRVAQGSRQAVVAGCSFLWLLSFEQAKAK